MFGNFNFCCRLIYKTPATIWFTDCHLFNVDTHNYSSDQSYRLSYVIKAKILRPKVKTYWQRNCAFNWLISLYLCICVCLLSQCVIVDVTRQTPRPRAQTLVLEDPEGCPRGLHRWSRHIYSSKCLHNFCYTSLSICRMYLVTVVYCTNQKHFSPPWV